MSWESRLTLYVGYLINKRKKSTTIKSYISAIRAVLEDINQPLNENKAVIKALTKACRLKNDRVYSHFPIKKQLLTAIINKLNTISISQPYLQIMYQAIFSAAYFGMFRVGEITYSNHVVKAKMF